MLRIFFFLSIFVGTLAFHSTSTRQRLPALAARLRKSDGIKDAGVAQDYVVGEDIPKEIAENNCIYDMILVERYSQPEKTDFGLFLPKVEGKDQKHLGKVLSVPTSYGLESENGRLQPVDEICPYKVGDVVFIKDPWGIGPQHIEVGKRCFSFHKAAHITGVIEKA